MTNVNDTSRSDEFRRGSEIGVCVLRALVAMSKSENHPGVTADQAIAAESQASGYVIRASSADNPFVKGFIGALADYIYSGNTYGPPNLDEGYWAPVSAMSAQELEEYRKVLDCGDVEVAA